MFEDDDQDEHGQGRSKDVLSPADRAREKSDEFRMHAQLAAVFEAPRKFDADLRPLDAEAARDLQRAIAKLEKAKDAEHPILPENAWPDARSVLLLPVEKSLTTNDYHVYRRPGEVMIARWIAADEVEQFYGRLQAHFDAAMNHFRKEERQSNEWRQDPKTLQYLDELDKVEVKMEDRYLRPIIKQHGVYVLSTQTIDEIDILYLCDYVMGVDPTKLVGDASAPPEEGATESDRAWFFKLYSLRGIVDSTERMCFFTYMQKAGDSW